jgi:hypothetical protein
LRLAWLLVVLLVGGVVGLTVPASAAAKPDSYANRLITLVNQARSQQGLATLTVTSGTSQVAGAWTEQLAGAGSLSHNPNLAADLSSHGSPSWTSFAEVVGRGSTDSADKLFTAYMNSSEHRDHLLNGRYAYLGIGVVFAGNAAWNTMDLVDSYQGAPAVVAPAPAPKPPPAPATVVPAPAQSTTVRHTPASSPPRAVAAAPRRVSAPEGPATQAVVQPSAVAAGPSRRPHPGVVVAAPPPVAPASDTAAPLEETVGARAADQAAAVTIFPAVADPAVAGPAVAGAAGRQSRLADRADRTPDGVERSPFVRLAALLLAVLVAAHLGVRLAGRRARAGAR